MPPNVVAIGAPLPPPPPVPLRSKVEPNRVPLPVPPPPPPPPPGTASTMPPPPPVPLRSKVEPNGAPLLVPPPPPLGTSSTMPPLPPPGTASTIPPPPASLKTNVVAIGAPLPLPPPVPLRSKVEPNGAPLPVPPPPPPLGTSSTMPPPPPPGTASTMPPPPPRGATKSLRPKKANTKLKRSSHMGNLYRVLRGKVEGFPLQSKSSGAKKIRIESIITSGKQGMSDALAETTKRSAYSQQIEDDVEKYAKSITELKTAISTFSTNDMTKLLKFHKHMESILENLTDETQVLARFEGFPTKKLEALRTASAIYSKLESMITVLQNWKFELPLVELLDKVDHYFNKIKGEIDALEQTKGEESKKFMSHNIELDFQILVRIKEAMVDVSSNCMELAMKERREVKLRENEWSKTKAEAQKKGSIKMLWRAFHLAFRVYTFAVGHDDRANMLSRELADEIQTDTQHP